MSTSPYIDYAPYFVAKDKGYFDAFQIDAELTVGSGSTAEILPLLAAGHVTVAGISLSAGFFNAVNTGSSVVVLTPQATIPHTGRSPVGILVTRAAFEAGLRSPVALKGKRVAIPGPAGFAEYSTALALRSVGLDITDVELVNLPPPETAAALINGSIDAGWVIEPFLTTLQRDGSIVALEDTWDRGVQFGMVAANGDFVRQEPEAAARFLAAWLRAARELEAGGWSEPVTQQIIERYTRLSGAQISELARSTTSTDGAVDLASVQAIEWYFRERGALRYTGATDFEALYRRDVLERARHLLGQ